LLLLFVFQLSSLVPRYQIIENLKKQSSLQKADTLHERLMDEYDLSFPSFCFLRVPAFSSSSFLSSSSFRLSFRSSSLPLSFVFVHLVNSSLRKKTLLVSLLL